MGNGPASPLEAFLLDFVDETGGVWDEVEPQVYDLLLAGDDFAGDRDQLRVTFDPEALPDHPGAQLAGFGTPLVDGLLSAAKRQGRLARAYLNGLNLAPHGLEGKLERALSWPDDRELKLDRGRALFHPLAIFWFEATFVSDQKEHEILPIAFDLHYVRQVRHFDQLLDSDALADQPDVFMPDAHHVSPARLLGTVRQQVYRTLVALAHSRARELNERVERQVARMQRYYQDMLAELDEQRGRAEQRGGDSAKYSTRREGILREQQLRIAEIRQNGALHVDLRLANLLLIRQPKIRIEAVLRSRRGAEDRLELVWDPLVETMEALPCPQCRRPTFVLTTDRRQRLNCPECP